MRAADISAGPKPFRMALRTFGLIGIGVFAMFYFLQRSMIYFPFHAEESMLLASASTAGLDPWRDAGGNIIGWKTPNAAPPNRVLILHGNAGYALHRTELVRTLERLPTGQTCQFFILEYPGYGARAGKPSQEALTDAALQAARLLQQDLEGRLVLLGESIGTGVAAAAANRMVPSPDGLLLLTPFDSLLSVAQFHYPWLPVALLLSDRYESAKNLRGFSGPVAVVVAEEDEVVPARLGRKLYDGLSGPKLLVVAPRANHNSLLGALPAEDWERVLAFALGRSDLPPPP